MVSRRWTQLTMLLASMVVSSTSAEENGPPPDIEFLEFLGEGRNVDGEYHDPLQMQDWVQQKFVDAAQLQEGEDNE